MKSPQNDTTSSISIHVAVGSTNPCKIAAVRSAFESAFNTTTPNDDDNNNNSDNNDITTHQKRKIQIKISSHDVPSGVSDQPFGDAETKKGATNRAIEAYKRGSNDNDDVIDFGVGLEGGIVRDDDSGELWCMAWMVIVGTNSDRCTIGKVDDYRPPSTTSSEERVWGMARTGSFLLPPSVSKLVNDGMELGDADDFVFKRVGSKKGEGTVGILTKGLIDRCCYYDHALKLALTPWIRPMLYVSKE